MEITTSAAIVAPSSSSTPVTCRSCTTIRFTGARVRTSPPWASITWTRRAGII
ncbi:MAG: hypothetical protein M5U19_02000 [Microthrixaceae bacterium]|nr:hypothetical protein [Microthrixaceae bacterium]